MKDIKHEKMKLVSTVQNNWRRLDKHKNDSVVDWLVDLSETTKSVISSHFPSREEKERIS